MPRQSALKSNFLGHDEEPLTFCNAGNDLSWSVATHGDVTNAEGAIVDGKTVAQTSMWHARERRRFSLKPVLLEKVCALKVPALCDDSSRQH